MTVEAADLFRVAAELSELSELPGGPRAALARNGFDEEGAAEVCRTIMLAVMGDRPIPFEEVPAAIVDVAVAALAFGVEAGRQFKRPPR